MLQTQNQLSRCCYQGRSLAKTTNGMFFPSSVSRRVKGADGVLRGGVAYKGKEIVRALAHGLSGGIQSELQGGNFWQGVGGSFAGSLIGSATGNLRPEFQITASVGAGGFTSLAMGGKFMEGAINAGIVVGFNHLAHQMEMGKPPRKYLKNQYGDPAISIKEFCAVYSGCTETEIITGESSKFGYKFPNRMGVKGTAFVTLNTGDEIDMIHFMVVGRRGLLMGAINEFSQLGTKSHQYPQDTYSNKLGVNFFNKYSTQLNNNPAKISKYIGWYLTNPKNH
jgi:hypothetical protein